MEKLLLIDGNSLINRAFYATPPLSDKSGRPTNAVFGFVNMLIKTINDLSPKYILVAFDRKEPTFRHEIYKEYKGTRKPMPEDLRPQIPLLKEVLIKMGICIFDKAGIEADDIIGTLSKRYNNETIIITGDKDSFQLVDDSTKVYFTRRGISDIEEYNNQNFLEKTGVLPNQIIDLKGCMGDSSDNIPGILGVGEKTALSLVQNYGSIEKIYENVNDFKGKLQEKIINGKESAFLSKKLATINTCVEIPLKIEDMLYSYPFNDAVKRIFTELDFRGFLKREDIFEKTESTAEKDSKITIVEVKTIEELNEILKNDKLSIILDKNIHLSLNNKVEYVLKIKETFFDDGLDYDRAILGLKSFLEKPNKKVVLYSVKKFVNAINEFDISLNAFYDDVDIQRYLVDFSGREDTVFDTLYYFNYPTETPASSLFNLCDYLYNELNKESILNLYLDVELPLSKVLLSMEEAGFKIDLNELNSLGEVYKIELDKINVEIDNLLGEKINVNSPKQLSDILFTKLNLTKTKKNKTGAYTTSAEALEEIQNEHPVIPLILRHRTLQKLYSTYIEGIKPLVDKSTGLIHTSFNQTLTQTGRLSSKEPNLQNIPVRDEEGKELRKMFIARGEDRVLIDADYSQIELRLLAHFSKSEQLISAYNNEEDIHSITASQVFGVPINEVDSQMRRSAKAVNFGIIYGISEYGLSKNLKISPKKAKEYIDKYFETYKSVKNYMAENVDIARKNGYITTILGRKRVIKEINSPNYNLRSFGERAAMNMPLQGSSADIIKIAMINVYNRLKKECPDAKLIMQVHDELIIDAKLQDSELAKKILKEEMENAVKISVPLTVEVSIGKSWYDAK